MPKPAELHTTRLLLRSVQVSDSETLFGFGRDEEFAYFYFAEPGYPPSSEILTGYIRETIWEHRPDFVVLLDGTVIGEAYINVDRADLTGELGYAIARPHWGKGFALEAARAVLDYSFNVLDLAKMFAVVDPRNVRSVRVLEKLRMKPEGLLRSHVIRRGERADKMYFGILRQEWEATK